MPVEGADVIAKRFRLLARGVTEAIEDEMNDVAEELLSDSRDLSPQLTGALIASSGVDSLDRRRDGEFIRSIFYDTPYAVAQHEGSFNPGPITRQKPGAGRKYLQRAYDAKKRKIIERIGRRTEQAMRFVLR
jgi:hypothetical protein